MRRIFEKDGMNSEFRTNGFLVQNLLSEEQARDLRTAFERHCGRGSESPFYTTTASPDIRYRKLNDRIIRNMVAPAVTKLFDGYEILYASFIIKRRGFRGKIGLHADWQFVEEPEYSAINIWIALQDVGPFSGTLKVIPGSHRYVNQSRGPNYKLDEKHFDRSAKLVTVPLRKGQAIIYDSRLLHASANNLLIRRRIVASALVVPREATILYQFFDPVSPHRMAHRHEVDRNFYLERCDFTPHQGIWKYVDPQAG